MDSVTDKLDKIPEPTDSRYFCNNTGGVELAVGEFLYGLVRMTKPKLILETGTHWGIGASYMADGLRENEKDGDTRGRVITLEYETQNLSKAKELFVKLGLELYIQTELVSSLDYQPQNQFDMIFLDTEPGIRFQELIKYFPSLKPGGFILIHDLHYQMGQTGTEMNGMMNWPFGTLSDQIKDWLKDGELKSVPFRTPRGLMMYYKPAPEDYKP